MASDEPVKPGPVVLRIKLRYEDLDTMVHRFAPNVGKSGLFIPTRALQPIGAEVKFELRLANDTPVLVGHGRVKFVREPDPKNAKASFGMAVELMRVTRESREVILRMLERRRTLGLPEVGIPMPEDLEVPVAKPSVESAPVLTAPRRSSGPIAIAKLAEVAALAPEPPRKKRPMISDLIASASQPVMRTTIPELDQDVDVAAAMARARVLAAGTDLDGELEALRDQAAAPVEISVEAASAELARQLGGLAVSRRSSVWIAPPPVVAEAKGGVEVGGVVAARGLVEVPKMLEAKTDPVIPPAAETVVDQAPEAPSLARTRTPVFEGEQLDELLREDAPREGGVLEARSRERRLGHRARTRSRNFVFEAEPTPEPEEIPVSEAEVVGEESDAIEMASGLISDQVDPVAFEANHGDPHELLDDADLVEEVEHTQLGQLPVDPYAFAHHAFVTEPAIHDPEALASSLDAQLAEAEADEEVDSALAAEAVAQLAGDSIGAAEELDDLDILAEADADDADLLLAHGEIDIQSETPAPEFEQDEHLRAVSEAPEHLDDLDSNPEHLMTYAPAAHFPPSELVEPARPTSEADFMARLDFSDALTPAPADPLSGFARDSVADLGAFAFRDEDDYGEGYARRSDPAAFHEPIEPLPTYELDRGSRNDIPAIEEDDFLERRAANPMRISVRTNVLNPDETFNEPSAEAAHLAQPPQDLDDALEALDVDLDDLSIPHARRPTTGIARVANQAGASPAKPSRAPSEDGILIDFGDDE